MTFPVSLPDLVIPLVAKRANPEVESFGINVEGRDWPNGYLRGALFRYETFADIIYAESQNQCWRRLSVAKELAHLLIDSDTKHFTKDPVALVQELITDVPLAKLDTPFGSEKLAALIAVELLLPWKLRLQIYEMRDQGMKHLEIAGVAKVPEQLITLALNDSYHCMCKEIYGL
jgi:Zn-dependent peptidase ImmA (M78 family)